MSSCPSPETVLAYALNSNTRPLRRKLRKVPGAETYRRSHEIFVIGFQPFSG